MMQLTALDIIRYISTEIDGKSTPLEVKIRDVQMMRFKVRSLIGDISLVDRMDQEIIESLWKIGKIDQIISEHIDTISEDDQETLMAYFESMESHMRESIRHSFELKPISNKQQTLKLEIFKDAELPEISN